MSKWISKTNRPRNEAFICSCCAKEVRYTDGLARVKDNPRIAVCEYKFCPWCGEKIGE